MAATAYEVVDLGSLGGGNSFAFDVNNQGQVVGRSTMSGEPITIQAFTWDRDPGIQPLPRPQGFTQTQANAVNNDGTVVITAGNGPQAQRAYLVDDGGSVIDLGTLGGTWARGEGINDTARVVGASQLAPAGPGEDGAANIFHAYVWSDGMMTDLGTLGGPRSSAEAINRDGMIVGWAMDAAQQIRSFVFHQGQMLDLGTAGGPGAVAHDINDTGLVVGDADIGRVDRDGFHRYHAVTWEDGVVTDLGSLGGQFSSANAVNDDGLIVGWSQVLLRNRQATASRHAFVWSDGVMTDLHDLIPADSTWHLEEATAVNDSGQIVGFGRLDDDPGRIHAFVLEPLFPDLEAQWVRIAAPTTLIPGDRFRVTLMLVNQGRGPVAGRTTLDVHLSPDTSFDAGQDVAVAVIDRVRYDLAPGAGRKISLSLSVPGDVEPGDYYLLARADVEDRVDEAGRDQNVTASDAALPVAWQFGRVGMRRGVRLVLRQPSADGTTDTSVTYRLGGAGTGQVVKDAEALDLRVSQTTGRSRLRIGSGRRQAPSSLRHIVVNGPLGKFSAPQTVLRGDMTIDGTVAVVELLGAEGGGLVAIGPAGRPKDLVRIDIGRVEDLSVVSQTPIKTLSAIDWLDRLEGPQRIEAPWIGSVTITGDRRARIEGDLDADLITLAPPARADALGAVIVAGTIRAGHWRIVGNVGLVSAEAIAFAPDTAAPLWSAEVEGRWNMLRVHKSAGGSVTAQSIDAIDIGDSLMHSRLNLQHEPDTAGRRRPTLGKLNVGRWVEDVLISSAGDVGAIRAGGLRNSQFFVGVREGVELPASSADFVTLASLSSVHVQGVGGARPLIVDSRIAAWDIDLIVARHAAGEGDEAPLRIAAHQIGALTYRDRQEVLRLRRPADFQARLDSQAVEVTLV